MGSAHLCWKADPDQSFKDAATGPSLEFDDFVGGDESFGEASGENHLGGSGSDARRWRCRRVRYFGLGRPCCGLHNRGYWLSGNGRLDITQ